MLSKFFTGGTKLFTTVHRTSFTCRLFSQHYKRSWEILKKDEFIGKIKAWRKKVTLAQRHPPNYGRVQTLRLRTRRFLPLEMGMENVGSASQTQSAYSIAMNRNALARFFMQVRRIRIFGHTFEFAMAEVAGHASFLLLAVSFLSSDIFWLRAMALVSGCAAMIFQYWHPYGRPLWLPLKWNFVFVTTNVAQLLYLMYENRQGKKLTVSEISLYHTIFAPTGLSKRNYVKLLRAGQWELLEPGTNLTTEGNDCDLVRVLWSGSARVYVKDRLVYEIQPGQFIGEMGLHAGIRITDALASTATTKTTKKTECLKWKRMDLITLMDAEPNIGAAVEASISNDLVRKALQLPVRTINVKPVIRDRTEATDAEKPIVAGGTGGVPVIDEDKTDKTSDDYAQVLASKHKQMYRILVGAVVSNGIVSSHERSTLQRYKYIHTIDDADHWKILKDLGWSEKHYMRGYKDPKHAPALEKLKVGVVAVIDQPMHPDYEHVNAGNE